MDPTGLRLLLFCILFASVQLCEIPAGNSHRIRSVSTELLKLTEDASEEPNPSVYLGLRLSDDHSLEKERQYLERLKDAFQPSVSTTPSAVSYHEEPGTGRLALHLLVLRAACHNMETLEGSQLVTQLKLHLHKEKERIGHEGMGHPITNYYQYSLGILALCVHGKKVDEHVIHKLLSAEERTKLSVDTEAMAGLAFVCLGKATFYTPELVAKLGQAIQRAKQKILQAQTPEGAFGNIYSSPLAVQFLIATGMSQECPEAVATLLRSLERGDFQNALIKSQLLPVLQDKSYLDIASTECRDERDSLTVGPPSPELELPTGRRESTLVKLIVKRPPRHLPLYLHFLTVPRGSSLLDVLKTAEKLGGAKPFTFETQNTLSGPLLTAVMGVKAQEGERKYWKILRAPNTLLEQGIADYIPQDKESILLKFFPW
ncbi:transcobalamin-2 [Rhineura floridana]|uniref:transcobalamin-2 n=1 Tax=Rhineura floridana TaxID=261503 RepID=UPI002AC85C20|nr:transcobalamin-2 [Rhineura floridana]XP_061458453.1 transcobalamin-2 [Rhineura floridana]XP_061458454.1 transcobalamin-2 [Rhineura floridana]